MLIILTPEGGDMDRSEAKEGNSSENASESQPSQPPRKKKKTEVQRLEKAFELLTAFSNQTTNDECQHFGNMIAAKLRNYDTIRCVIQNEIMSVFLNENRGVYERYHHTHLQPMNPPQAHFPSGPSKMYPQSINPPPHTSFISLFSKPFSVMFWKHFSPFSQYNNSFLPHSFRTESISPATTSSEENINIQLFVE
jgi:hypothetical protein